MTVKKPFCPIKGAYTIEEAAGYLIVCERQIRVFIARALLRKSKALRAVQISGAERGYERGYKQGFNGTKENAL